MIRSNRFVAISAIAFAVGCGTETNALVGARCQDGLIPSGTTCVAPGSANDQGPAPGAASSSGGSSSGGSSSGGSSSGGSSSGGSSSGGSSSGSSSGSSGAPASDDGGSETATASADDAGATADDAGTTTADATDAGATASDDASTITTSTTDAGALADAGPTCTSPQLACGGSCVAADTDPANCGACGKICPSGVCQAGMCAGETPGDVVLIGQDYAHATAGSPTAEILARAVGIPTTNPIRVLTWSSATPSDEVSNIESLASAGIVGRRAAFSAGSSDDLASPSLASFYDVIVLFDAGRSGAAQLGASWASALGTFTQRGGVVVALDDGSTDVPSLLSNAGLLQVTSHQAEPAAAPLVVWTPGDVVGSQVPSPYAANGAVTFAGIPAPTRTLAWVVVDGASSAPVVVHRVVP